MKKNSLFSLILIFCFMLSLSLFTSCGGSKKGHAPVKSGAGMGNKKHKNKHVWGK